MIHKSLRVERHQQTAISLASLVKDNEVSHE